MRQSRSVVLLFLCITPLIRAAGQSANDSTRTVPVAPNVRLPSKDWGASVIVIDSAEIALSSARTLSELLQARRPGVRVFESGGMASDGSMVMLRGPTSVSAPSEPIVMVDGARVDSRQYDSWFGGPTQPSRLDDIIPEDVERIEVLSGPAAALYGDGAASGVIIVTTKSGGRGPIRLSGRATWGVSQTRDDFPANYQRLGVSPTTGQPVRDCSLVAIANGLCTPTGLDVWNPLAQASPFHVGNSARGHIEAGGTTLGTMFSIGATGDQRQGTLPHDEGSRLAGRAKIERALPWHFSVNASGSYLADNARFGSGVLESGLLGTAQNDTNHGYLAFSGVVDSLIPRQFLHHGSGSAQLRWQPLAWLDAAVMTGRDRVTEHGQFDFFGPLPTEPVGNEFAYDEHTLTTTGGHIRAKYFLPRGIGAATGIGYDREILQTKSVDSIVVNGPLAQLTETQFRERSTAFWIDQRVNLATQLSIAVAAQRITSSMFGGGAGKEWFPSANLAWTPLYQVRGVSDLRMRAAYAEAANATSSLSTLPSVIVVPSFGAPPPPKPKLERNQEAEVSADATLGSTFALSITAFTSRAKHLWVTNPYVGTISQNAEMSNRGVEALIGAPLLDTHNLRWTASLAFAALHNEVTKLLIDPEQFVSGSVVQGKPYGGAWAQTYTYADANHDGIIGSNEVQLGNWSYIGAPLPSLESSLTTDLSLRGRIGLSATMDYRGGYNLFDIADGERCSLVATCRGAQDPSAPLDEQAAAVATRLAHSAQVASFMPNARFMRVREIALHWPLPASLSGALGASVVTVAARNIATWTNYRGLDPEVSSAPPGTLPRDGAYVLPLPRELIVRLDVGGRAP